MASVRVPGFLPTGAGFHFPNAFPSGPVLRVGVGSVRIPLGNAANGLCGGMIFAARDLFEAGIPPPADRGPPPAGTPLFRYLVARLFASFDLPTGPLRYLSWMWLPDRGLLGGLVRGRAWRTVFSEWPRVRADLDGGRLSALGLVRSRSLNPLEVGRNHQVLAYGYDLDAASGEAAIWVYDPNHPDDDQIMLRLSVVSVPVGGIRYVDGESPVYGFFRTRYRFRRPPLDVGS